jgi:DNA-binding winged helix-turn-helix (wHTH) protein
LLPSQFLLLEDDRPVSLGSRALEILIVLLERAGELVSKQELMARVWPNIFVEPANLTVHISALRRTLRDGRDGNRFIINIPGRGYCFVAPVGPARHERSSRASITTDAGLSYIAEAFVGAGLGTQGQPRASDEPRVAL